MSLNDGSKSWLDPKVETMFRNAAVAKKAGFSKQHLKIMYVSLVNLLWC